MLKLKKKNAIFSVIFTENSDFWRKNSSIFIFEIQGEIFIKSLLQYMVLYQRFPKQLSSFRIYASTRMRLVHPPRQECHYPNFRFLSTYYRVIGTSNSKQGNNAKHKRNALKLLTNFATVVTGAKDYKANRQKNTRRSR